MPPPVPIAATMNVNAANMSIEVYQFGCNVSGKPRKCFIRCASGTHIDAAAAVIQPRRPQMPAARCHLMETNVASPTLL
jgi:hypothetical protein